jgi:hypothetical protein
MKDIAWKSGILALAGFLSLVPRIPSAAAAEAPALVFGIGSSALADAEAAGREAAQAAKAGLGGAVPRVVVVFAARPQVNEALVKGVASSFERTLVYGCEGYSPLTRDTNFADQGHGIKSGVAVLAVGGAEGVTVASAGTQDEGKWEACGRKIGEQLKPQMGEGTEGKLILTFGDQHVGQNAPFLKGLHSVVDAGTPVVGAAAGGPEAKEIVAGEIRKAMNIAVLIKGPFAVRLACNGGGGDLVAKARNSVDSVLAEGREGAKVIFVFDCGGRRGELAKGGALAQELEAMKTVAGPIPLFGFYGGGEIGSTKAGQPAQGVGFSCATAAIMAK